MASYGINLTSQTNAPEGFQYPPYNNTYELDSDSSDSILDEFMNDPDFSVPVMNNMQYEYNSLQASALRNIYHNDYVIDIDVPAHPTLARYYLFNFAIYLLMGISFGSTLFVGTNNMAIVLSYEAYLAQKLIQLVIFSFITYGTVTASTYRSINYSIDILMINWVLYSYTIKTMFIYLLMQFGAALISGYITIGLYYYKFAVIDNKYIQGVILFVDESHTPTIDSFALLFIAHILLITGATTIMSHINSINCKSTFLMTLVFIYSVSIIYENALGPISFSLYKLCIYIAHTSVFGLEHVIEKNYTLLLMIVGLIIKLLLYPLITYYVRYVWSRKLKRYLEYSV